MWRFNICEGHYKAQRAAQNKAASSMFFSVVSALEYFLGFVRHLRSREAAR
jgi:hypothetical protein